MIVFIKVEPALSWKLVLAASATGRSVLSLPHPQAGSHILYLGENPNPPKKTTRPKHMIAKWVFGHIFEAGEFGLFKSFNFFSILSSFGWQSFYLDESSPRAPEFHHKCPGLHKTFEEKPIKVGSTIQSLKNMLEGAKFDSSCFQMS